MKLKVPPSCTLEGALSDTVGTGEAARGLADGFVAGALVLSSLGAEGGLLVVSDGALATGAGGELRAGDNSGMERNSAKTYWIWMDEKRMLRRIRTEQLL